MAEYTCPACGKRWTVEMLLRAAEERYGGLACRITWCPDCGAALEGEKENAEN